MLEEIWLKVLSYPANDVNRALILWNKIKGAGIVKLVSYGDITIDNLRVIGKGHSSIVVLGIHKNLGRVAIKFRRADSKTQSLITECRLMKIAYPLAPKIYFCDDDVIIREFIEGTLLINFIDKLSSCKEALSLTLKLLAVGYWLDLKGIDHKELSIPNKHIIICPNGSVKVIDFESGRQASSCNLCRLASWALIRRALISKLCNINISYIENTLIELLRNYKKGSKDSYHKLLKFLIDIVREGNV